MLRRALAALLFATIAFGPGAAAADPASDVNGLLCGLGVDTSTLTAGTTSEAPFIRNVYRNTAGERSTWETAGQFDGRYWSRTGGQDFVIELANPGKGNTLNVYKNRKLVHSEPVSGCDPFVTVPVGAGDGDYLRTFQFESQAGLSPASSALFAVDTIAPTIAQEVRTSATTTDVTFTEPVFGGRDSFADWLVEWTAGEHTLKTQVEEVRQIDTRTRQVRFVEDAAAGYVRVVYIAEPGAPRYTDAAGNPMADTL